MRLLIISDTVNEKYNYLHEHENITLNIEWKIMNSEKFSEYKIIIL